MLGPLMSPRSMHVTVHTVWHMFLKDHVCGPGMYWIFTGVWFAVRQLVSNMLSCAM
jgi:hypothetical protein